MVPQGIWNWIFVLKNLFLIQFISSDFPIFLLLKTILKGCIVTQWWESSNKFNSAPCPCFPISAINWNNLCCHQLIRHGLSGDSALVKENHSAITTHECQWKRLQAGIFRKRRRRRECFPSSGKPSCISLTLNKQHASTGLKRDRLYPLQNSPTLQHRKGMEMRCD